MTKTVTLTIKLQKDTVDKLVRANVKGGGVQLTYKWQPATHVLEHLTNFIQEAIDGLE